MTSMSLRFGVCVSHSVMSSYLPPHGLYPTRLLCPWNSPGKNTQVGCYFLLKGIFLTQGLNPGLLHCRQILYHLSYQRGFDRNWQLTLYSMNDENQWVVKVILFFQLCILYKQHVLLVYACFCACVLSHFSHVGVFATLWTVTSQAPLSMGFCRQDTGVGCHSLLEGGVCLVSSKYNLHLQTNASGAISQYHWPINWLIIIISPLFKLKVNILY